MTYELTTQQMIDELTEQDAASKDMEEAAVKSADRIAAYAEASLGKKDFLQCLQTVIHEELIKNRAAITEDQQFRAYLYTMFQELTSGRYAWLFGADPKQVFELIDAWAVPHLLAARTERALQSIIDDLDANCDDATQFQKILEAHIADVHDNALTTVEYENYLFALDQIMDRPGMQIFLQFIGVLDFESCLTQKEMFHVNVVRQQYLLRMIDAIRRYDSYSMIEDGSFAMQKQKDRDFFQDMEEVMDLMQRWWPASSVWTRQFVTEACLMLTAPAYAHMSCAHWWNLKHTFPKECGDIVDAVIRQRRDEEREAMGNGRINR